MIRYHASWVLPISEPPLSDGWIAVDRGRVVGLGRSGPSGHSNDVDLGNVAVLPGLVNAHTHLELSYLRGTVPPESAFVNWVRGVLHARSERRDRDALAIVSAVHGAVAEALTCGTAVVGDISNTLVSFEPLARSQLAAVVFYELIRFNEPEPAAFVAAARGEIMKLAVTERVRPSLAAHAPYSVSPRVFRAIHEAVARDALTTPCSVHLSESAEETEFIRSGTGPWRALLEEIGAWDPRWVPPGGTPVEFLDEAGFLGPNVLAVHGVQMTPGDLNRLRDRRVTLVTCPRSNTHTGAGAPPVAAFYGSGVRVAVGTDSLASAPDLNVFAELATLRALAPQVPAAALLDSATRQGAQALGFDADYGTIESGKLARLIAVSLPPRVDDVEEYLVNGIQPDQVRWIN